MQSVSNIFALQTSFQHEQCLFQNEHSFTMSENSEEGDAWEKLLERDHECLYRMSTVLQWAKTVKRRLGEVAGV